MSLFIGLMSGTSMDGIDAALVDLNNHQCLAGITRPYGKEAWDFLTKVINGSPLALGTLSQLNTLLGREFGAAVLELLKKAKCPPSEVSAIGSHGQTICHDASGEIPYTLQLGCPHTIAEMTGIRVVADFRTRDMVVGGQGAPFAPLYHQVLFAEEQSPIMVVNIGGIANVTFLEKRQPPKGHDVGPGNCLMDAWIREVQGHSYDANGAWAGQGQVIEPLLLKLLAEPFFQKKPPKSIGKEYFSLNWLKPYLQKNDIPVDVQATLLELTAILIAKAIPSQMKKVVICGGGVHNAALLSAIQRHAEKAQILSSCEWGVDPDFIEAMMFAWLAEKTIHEHPIDLSALTGAQHPVILGAIYPVCARS